MTRYAIIDDTNPDLVYTGTWRSINTPLNIYTPEYNNTVHATNDPNATITYNFYGTVLNVYGSIDAPAIHGYPNASYTIQPRDTVPIKHFNQTGTVPPIVQSSLNVATSHIKMFVSGKFAEGNYTMTIKADGASTDGATFYFDYLTVLSPDSVYVEDVILDDTDSQWDYEGTWGTGQNTAGSYLITTHTTPKEGGTATLGFHGTEIAVYGTLDGPFNASLPVGYFQINGGVKHEVLAGNITKESLLTNGTQVQNQIIWSTTGLPDVGQKQHSITISVPAPPPTPSTSGSTTTTTTTTGTTGSATITSIPTNPPWQLDYVVYGPSYALSSLPTATSASSTSSAPPAGAIAGGVIGGLAGIALLIIAFLLLYRRRQRAKAAQAEVQEEFTTEYATSTAASKSRPSLAGRRSSIRKGSRGNVNNIGGGGGGGAVVGNGEVLDISHNSPLASVSGRVGTSTMTGPGTADSAYDTEYYPANDRRLPPRPVREMDGGVRLASGSDIDEEVVEVLPPSYARY